MGGRVDRAHPTRWLFEGKSTGFSLLAAAYRAVARARTTLAALTLSVATLATLATCLASAAHARVPATPLMTVYRFDGPLDVPTYDADVFAERGVGAVAGSLAQGTSVIPCLVIRDGKPLTDASGTPFVGFEVVVDARRAVPEDTAAYRETFARRQTLTVENHHCPPGVDRVIDVRHLATLDKAPWFDPPRAASAAACDDGASGGGGAARSTLDPVVRAFHESQHCAQVQRRLIGRRAALEEAWDAFARGEGRRFGADVVERARALDYTMRTAIYEAHLDRGCGAYGACERNVIALSIRNRARACSRAQGCRFPGDVVGVASKVSQYNIWDEVLTQVTGLASCFLRRDLARDERYAKLQAMYEQSVLDVERILFADDAELAELFPGIDPATLATLRHYYHPPAMGKCFPNEPRVEYISGAVARRGDDFVLIAGTRVEVGEKRGSGYAFRAVTVEETPRRDVLRTADRYPGFLLDARKVTLQPSKSCRPWGTPPGCSRGEVGRHRKVPSWLSTGRPLAITCRVRARDPECTSGVEIATATVGGACDVDMQPVAGVP